MSQTLVTGISVVAGASVIGLLLWKLKANCTP